MKHFIPVIIMCLPWITSCSHRKTDNQTIDYKLQSIDIKNPVEVIVLRPTTFQKELLSNGKLIAHRKSVLKFYINEELTILNVRNGDKVIEGQIIAELRKEKLQHACKRAEIQMEKAILELKDILIGQGYQLEDSISIPEFILRTAQLRSGYASAIYELQDAQMNLKNSVLIAPFPGVVANLTYKVHEHVSSSDDFCTLIDNSGYVVEFVVLESEFPDIRLNKTVKVSPFVRENDIYTGTITEINPVVDVNGHILVKAMVKNTPGLLDGMNVKVKIETSVPDRLVVPKSAIVQRQNQEVLFKFTNGKAFWTYVKTGYENSTSYSVIAHPEKGGTLKPGDTVIVSGNLNLSHESEVVIK